MSNTDRLPLPNNDMPPLPKSGEFGAQVCATVRLYLSIVDDLTPEQRTVLNEHVRICAECAKVQHLLQYTTSLFTNLPSTAPSRHVDQAVMAAIVARSKRQFSRPFPGDHQTSRQGERQARPIYTPTLAPVAAYTLRKNKHKRGFAGKPFAVSLTVIAAAAMLFFVMGMTLHFWNGFPPSKTQTFSLPTNFSWNGYVLYQSETRLDAKGIRYNVDTYDNLGTGQMHVETVMPGSLDVVAVSDKQQVLGLDMMHQVAAWGAIAWSVDETAFDLAALRSDLAADRAEYLDEDLFRGQTVYRVRCRNGLVLLLDMHYNPVNVLRGAVGPGTGEPIYDTLKLMPTATVSHSMWDMSIPAGFRMGKLPQLP